MQESSKSSTSSQHTFSTHLDLLKLQTKTTHGNKTKESHTAGRKEIVLPRQRKIAQVLISVIITVIIISTKIIFPAMT